MNRRTFLSLAIAIASLFTLLAQSDANAQCTCRAKARCGPARCSVTCPAPFGCYCRSGVYSVKCICIPPGPPPRVHFDFAPIDDNQRRCAMLLRDYLRSLGTPEAINLANAIDFVINAHDSGDPNVYSDAENNYCDVNEATSSALQQMIEDWMIANGCVWP